MSSAASPRPSASDARALAPFLPLTARTPSSSCIERLRLGQARPLVDRREQDQRRDVARIRLRVLHVRPGHQRPHRVPHQRPRPRLADLEPEGGPVPREPRARLLQVAVEGIIVDDDAEPRLLQRSDHVDEPPRRGIHPVHQADRRPRRVVRPIRPKCMHAVMGAATELALDGRGELPEPLLPRGAAPGARRRRSRVITSESPSTLRATSGRGSPQASTVPGSRRARRSAARVRRPAG